jgi:hypothetical protein
MRERERTGRNTEWRRKGDNMDERDMEEEGKNRKRKGGGRKKFQCVFGIGRPEST